PGPPEVLPLFPPRPPSNLLPGPGQDHRPGGGGLPAGRPGPGAQPLGMRHTYWPKPGEQGIRGQHAHMYGVHPAAPEAGVVDTTRMPGYLLGASGGLVSTPKDLNRFWQGVFGGRLLSAKSLRAMTSAPVAVRQEGWPSQARYGHG